MKMIYQADSVSPATLVSQDRIDSDQLLIASAHLNLRDYALPYKNIIAEVLIDKNPGITTVINKIQNVGEENEYRTFQYEVLAGADNMNVTVKETDCIFEFDFSKVYWNTRLQTEHKRLVDLFRRGTAVCDVMAGVGPFAVPAGKDDVFVWANDLNPDCFKYLKQAISKNKVERFVKPFNEDGRTFIKRASKALFDEDSSVEIRSMFSSRELKDKLPTEKPQNDKLVSWKPPSPEREGRKKIEKLSPRYRTTTLKQPKFFSHYVMNLPASAITFLPSFIGLYSSLSDEVQPDWPLPMIHVYTFALKPERNEDNSAEIARVWRDISELLGTEIKEGDQDASVYDVRDVAPKKTMFCASFRLPADVAWRKVEAG